MIFPDALKSQSKNLKAAMQSTGMGTAINRVMVGYQIHLSRVQNPTVIFHEILVGWQGWMAKKIVCMQLGSIRMINTLQRLP